ncbi:MAG: hypothetical protein RJA07_2838, partial [Bacteroidota bacterium]
MDFLFEVSLYKCEIMECKLAFDQNKCEMMECKLAFDQ